LSGVPQGSVLRPLLLLIFINDLPNVLDPIVASKLFADDFKAYNIDDYRLNPGSTQNALDALSKWAATWQLELAIPKCGSLLLNTNTKFVDENDLFIGNNILPVFNSVLDLGVTIDCNLTFAKHIQII